MYSRGVNKPCSESELLRVRECALQIRVSARTVRRWIRTGVLPAVRIGGVIRVRESELEKAMRAQPPQPTPEKEG